MSHRTGPLDGGCAEGDRTVRYEADGAAQTIRNQAASAAVAAMLGHLPPDPQRSLRATPQCMARAPAFYHHKVQYKQLTELRAFDPRVAAVYRELLDSALRKVDLAYRAFFRRVRKAETPGFPRFRAARRYNTLEFPHGNRALRFSPTQSKVVIPGVGSGRIRKGREVQHSVAP